MELSAFPIRIAKENDISAIAGIMKEAVENLQQREWFVDDNEEYLAGHIHEEGYTLVWDEGGEIGGFLVMERPLLSEHNLGRFLHFTDEELLRVIHLESACVRTTFRGKGIQKKLMQKALWMEETGSSPDAAALARPDAYPSRHALCTVHPDNVYSLNNVRSLGLAPVFTGPVYGGWVRHVMYRKLDGGTGAC